MMRTNLLQYFIPAPDDVTMADVIIAYGHPNMIHKKGVTYNRFIETTKKAPIGAAVRQSDIPARYLVSVSPFGY